MKYEVIGWTYCGNDKYSPHENITASVDAAVIREIREHKYLFGGDAHEDYAPVLNDGTYADYSWRGWGRIMALAYGVEGECSYMYAYMDRLIKPEARNYPDSELPDDSRIVPKESLVEVFEMHLADDMFEKVKAGVKTVELRLFDEKRKKVDIGDHIEFIRQSDEAQRVIKRVVDLRPYATFEKLFRLRMCKGNGEEVFPGGKFTAEQAGMPANADKDALVNEMYRYYDQAQEKEHGVIAFWLETPRHACRTKLRVFVDYALNAERDGDLLSQEDGALSLFSDEGFGEEPIEYALEEISTDFRQRGNSFEYGENTDYDADVNVMLRKTLGGLFGCERALKAIRHRYGVAMQLEVFATIIEDSQEPKQRLSLDKDIADFLQQSGVRLKLDCKTI